MLFERVNVSILKDRIAGAVSNIMWYMCIQIIPISQAFTIMNLYPLFQIIICRIVFGYQIEKLDLLNFLIGFSGIVLVLKPYDHSQFESMGGYLLTFLATFIFCCGIVSIRGIPSSVKNPQIVVHFSIIIQLISTLSLIATGSSREWNPSNLLFFILLGIFALMQQSMLNRAYSLERPTRLGVLSYLTIIFGILVDKFYYRMEIDSLSWIGSLLIILTAFINLYKTQS